MAEIYTKFDGLFASGNKLFKNSGGASIGAGGEVPHQECPGKAVFLHKAIHSFSKTGTSGA